MNLSRYSGKAAAAQLACKFFTKNAEAGAAEGRALFFKILAQGKSNFLKTIEKAKTALFAFSPNLPSGL